MIAAARIAAFQVLTGVSSGRADLPTALAAARASLSDERDRALVGEIATGVQRWRARLDAIIMHAARRPVDRLDAEIIEILRLSAYQLLYLTRVPAAAIVDDAVKLSRRAGKTSASGFVNAVLRTISRTRGELPLPPRPAHPEDRDAALAYLSTTLSHPGWLAARWYDRLGFDTTEQWLQFNNAPAPLTLRANRLRVSRDELQRRLEADGVQVSAGRFAPDALRVEHGRPESEDGLFVVQDEASQLVTLLAGAAPGDRVLDTCASPGGKATALAATLSSRGLLVACDVRDRRIALLQRTVTAMGARAIRIVQANVLHALPFRPQFNCVIVDAPCSGLGTLRRDPDIRWRRQEADLEVLAADQLRMLNHAAASVAARGRLIYATCSSEPEENERVVDRFLAGEEGGGFTAVHAHNVHPELPSSVVDERGHLRTTPDRHALECFFGAVFERQPA